MVAFAGTASDPDIAASQLEVVWTSDKASSSLGTSIPNSNGDIAFLTSTLPAEPQIVTMTVTDEVGATCVDSIEFVVGTPPDVVVTGPIPGARHIQGQTVAFSAQVSDQEDLPTDLLLDWTSSLDGSISTQGADSSGAAAFSIDGILAKSGCAPLALRVAWIHIAEAG